MEIIIIDNKAYEVVDNIADRLGSLAYKSGRCNTAQFELDQLISSIVSTCRIESNTGLVFNTTGYENAQYKQVLDV